MTIMKSEYKGDYVREVEGALRKAETNNRLLQTANRELTDDLRRLKRQVTAQATEIAKLKAI